MAREKKNWEKNPFHTKGAKKQKKKIETTTKHEECNNHIAKKSEHVYRQAAMRF